MTAVLDCYHSGFSYGFFFFFLWSEKAETSSQKFLLSEIAIVETYQAGPEKISPFLQSEEKLCVWKVWLSCALRVSK